MYRPILAFIFALFCASSIVAQAPTNASYIRFVSAVNETVVITTDSLGTFTLNFEQVTNYTLVLNNTLIVNATINGLSVLTQPTQLTFLGFTTCAAVFKNGTFTLVLFNETAPTQISTDNTTDRAWIRIINLGEGIEFVTIQYNATSPPIFSFIGYLDASPYIPINASTTTQLTGSESSNQTNNSFPITFQDTITASSAYTLFTFTPANSSPNGIVVFDRVVLFNATTPIATSGVTQSNMTSGQAGTSGIIGATSSATAAATSGQASPSATTSLLSAGTSGVFVTTSQTSPESSSASSIKFGIFYVLNAMLLLSSLVF